MGSEHPRRLLQSLCSLVNRGIAPSYVKEGGLLVINQKCIRNQEVFFAEARRTDPSTRAVSQDRLLRPFDILVNSTGVGTVGRVAQVRELSEAATVDSHVTIVRPDPTEIVPGYLGYALRFYQPAIEGLAEGSTGQTELSRSRLKELPIPCPPEVEQRAIVHILGTLDDKIELNRRMNDTLEEMARAIFKSWFVDFDPVRAKIEGRDPGLPMQILDVFPGRFDDSALGQIPAGWQITTLGDHVNVAKGLSYKGAGLAASGVPLHNLDSIFEGGGYKYEGIKYYTAEFADAHLVQPGDVIVANTEQGHDRLLIGHAAVVPQGLGSTGVFTHHLYRVRVKRSSPLAPTFLCYLLNSWKMHDVVSRYANGTTVNMLPRDGLYLPRFVLPPEELIRTFSRFAALIRDRHEEIICENRTLGALRDTLLPKLISGEIRLRAASAHREGEPLSTWSAVLEFLDASRGR